MNLLVPNGFEANYTVGFARGLVANSIPILVVSDDIIAGRLDAAGIPNSNLRGSQERNRPGWIKIVNLARYYLRLFASLFRHRGHTVHFTGLLGSRFILIEGIFLPPWIRLWSRRYVHTAHNALPHGRESSRFFRAMYRWIYRFPHTIVAHTAKVADQLEAEFGVDRRRIAVISIGLNEEIPPTDLSPGEARQRLGLSPGPLVLCFGKVERYKGIDVLIDAWDHLRTPAARLAIVGACTDDQYRGELRKKLSLSRRSAEISWHEAFVSNEEIALWMAACDVVVMPYRNIYQSGIVFLCLRLGVPIVATNVGSLAEYVEAHCGTIARSNDPAGIAEAIDRFFANLSNYSRDRIAQSAQKYRWDNQCAAIAALYERN